MNILYILLSVIVGILIIRYADCWVNFIIFVFRCIWFCLKYYVVGFYESIWLGVCFAAKYAKWWQAVIYFLILPLVIVLFPLCIFVGYLITKIKYDRQYILNVFASGNVIAEGTKGTGKDLLFSFVACTKPHYANIIYNENTELRQISDFNCNPNTYENLLDGEYMLCEKQNSEGYDYFISDGGISLACHLDTVLKKRYPSFPIYYALVRHLTNSSIHVNAQSFMRVWKPLREQAESFFHCNCTRIRRIFGVKIAQTELIYYSTPKGAESHVLPVRVGLFSTEAEKAYAAEHYARYGEVRLLTLWQVLPKKSYDSRIYHEYIYGEKSPTSNPKEVF